jgi:hypothetical protein
MTTPLEREFEARGVRRGGVLFLGPDAALALIAKARDRQVRVLGIDTFRITDSATQPLIHQSADYSDAPAAWEAAASFIRSYGGAGFMFEVVLDDGRAA